MKFVGLNIRGWPNIKNRIDAMIPIYNWVGLTQFQKLVHRGRVTQTIIITIITLSLSNVGVNNIGCFALGVIGGDAKKIYKSITLYLDILTINLA